MRAVVADEDRVLLVCTRDGAYRFPGGERSFGAPVAEILPRFVEEQTGYEVVPGDLLWIREEAGASASSVAQFFYRCNLMASVAAPHAARPDQAGVEWVGRHGLATIDLMPHSLVEPLQAYLTDREVTPPVYAPEST